MGMGMEMAEVEGGRVGVRWEVWGCGGVMLVGGCLVGGGGGPSSWLRKGVIGADLSRGWRWCGGKVGDSAEGEGEMVYM